MEQREEEYLYRAYVTESLYAYYNEQKMTRSWLDLVSKKNVDNRTAEDIVDDVISRAGLTLALGGE